MFAALGVVVFVVMNLGTSLTQVAAWKQELHGDRPVPAWWFALRGLRLHLSDDADFVRYAAYANAALGRPYQAYFVRTAADWEREFEHRGMDAHADFDPAAPLYAPPRPLHPYEEYAVEYPPGFFALTLPVALATHTPRGFAVLLSFVMGGFIIASASLVRRLVRQLGGGDRDADHAVAILTGSVVALGALTTHRYDAAVAFVVCAACVAAFAGRPALSGGLVAVGTALKVVPALAFVPLAIFTYQEARARGLVRFVAAAAATGLALLAPALVYSHGGLLGVLRYHSARPLEIESTTAAFFAIASRLLGGDVHTVQCYGSFGVEGQGDHLLILATRVAMLAGIGLALGVGGGQILRADDAQSRRMVTMKSVVAVFVAYMALGPVFSPQYLLWIAPLMAAVSLLHGRRVVAAWLLVLFGSQLLYPAFFWELLQLEPAALSLLVFRNIGLLALTGWLLQSSLPAQRLALGRSEVA